MLQLLQTTTPRQVLGLPTMNQILGNLQNCLSDSEGRNNDALSLVLSETP